VEICPPYPSQMIEGFQGLAQEIGRHISKSGIITFSWEHLGAQKWDVEKRKDGELRFGTDMTQSSFFPAEFLRIVSQEKDVGLVLRTFTGEKDEATGLPTRELRGYFVFLDGGRNLRFRQLSAREVAEASTTHYQTGKFLAPERSVIYCGPNHEFLDDNLNPIIR
jgi:hypothetical protein